MPESIYKSLKLWGVEEGGEEITLIDNSTIIPKASFVLSQPGGVRIEIPVF
jgi:hypothetical protein